MSFENKVVIVTGASSGIGASIALKFAEEGAKVVLVGRNKEKLKEVSKKCGITGSKLSIVADVSQESDMKRIIHETVQFFGQIDVLINNAGVMTDVSIVDDNVMEIFDQLMATNLRSCVYLTHLAAEHLIETKGNIINISSVCGLAIIGNNNFAYHTSKAAVDHFTRAVASEFAPKGVRVNTINPGPVRTNIMGSRGWNAEQEAVMWEMGKKMTALERIGEPNEIADLALFLASEKAVAITGSSFVADNGLLVNTSV